MVYLMSSGKKIVTTDEGFRRDRRGKANHDRTAERCGRTAREIQNLTNEPVI